MYIFIILIILVVITGERIFHTVASRDWQRTQSKDNPALKKENYHFGIYYNPDDNRKFVPRCHGNGFTLNLGKPVVVLIISLLIVVLLSLMV